MSWARLLNLRFMSNLSRCKNCQPRFPRASFKTQVAALHRCVVLSDKNVVDQKIKIDSDTDSDSDHHKEDGLTDLKLQILHAALNFVPEHGWTKKSIALGAHSLGLSTASHSLIPDGGADLVHYFNFLCNENLNAYLKEKLTKNSEKQNTQEFILDALEKRLRMVIPFVSRWHEALNLTISPSQLQADLKNLLDLVDMIWAHSGSKSLDTTWYSKRLSLAIAYKTCELSLVQDNSPEFSDSMDFLERRVEMVMSADQFLEQISVSSKQLPNIGIGAITTVRNILGFNSWNR